MKQIIYTQHTVNQEGTINEVKFIKREVRNTDEFVLMYFKHVSLMAKLPRYELQTLLCLAPHVNYHEGDFTAGIKLLETLVSCSGLTKSTVQNALTRLTKKNILHRLGQGWYQLNPELFWKGSEIERTKQFQLVYQWDIKE